ncbi:MAG TPA: type II toxin-antitoxin system VapC family toxin [Candidatus Kryptonia bacterium]
MKSIVLDSFAVIAYLENEPGYETVAEIFDECVAKNSEASMCIINWGEVIYHTLRVGGEKAARLAEDGMATLPIQLVEANIELTHQAAILKASNKMSYADCFAAALAMKKKGELVTGDSEFKQVEKSVKIRWMK